MNASLAKVFGGLVAIVLLALFSGSVLAMIVQAVKATPADAPVNGNEGLVYIATTVGGVVSALVISILGISRARPEMSLHQLTQFGGDRSARWIVAGYLLLWVVTGLAALVFGVILYPDAVPALGDIGMTWLGLSVTTTYVYFGLSKPQAISAVARQSKANDSDLKIGDKVPNKSEASAAGAITKRIKRVDAEFKTLVSNTNADIVFKDEEGTGADRVMSSRMKTKMDALATLVKAEWSGKKLRVTEAWDEDGEHSSGSLHYEGRAADITTSDIDKAKLGRLARLAVDAGFDWVFYEDASHVHVAVTK